MNRKRRLINKAINLTNYSPARRPKTGLRIIIFILVMILVGYIIFIPKNTTPTRVFEIPKSEPKAQEIAQVQEYQNEADFKVTYYCGCPKCCGKYSSGKEDIAIGAMGTQLKPFYSIAVDPNIIPLGTICYDTEGNPYEAVDTGGLIKGYHIDVFTGNHKEALNMQTSDLTLYW